MKTLDQYHEIFTHMTMSEKEKLYDLARHAPYGANIVEIGSFLGASTCFIARAVIDSRTTCSIHCVDTWNNDAMDNVEVRDVYAEFCGNIEGVKNRIVTHRGLSAEVGKDFPYPIDMIFFDGDHSPEGIHTDWDIWSPKLREGALVVFHDWDWAPGVKDVILNKVHPRIKKFDTLPNMWWGWL